MKFPNKRTLVPAILALILFGLCAAPTLAAQEADDASLQTELLTYSNLYRAGRAFLAVSPLDQRKVSPLSLDETLCDLAKILAGERDGYRGKSLYTRPDGTHWSTVLDNTAYDGSQIYNACLIFESKKRPDARDVLAAWMKSSEDRVLVLALQHRSTGMYTYYSAKNRRYYTVQLFTSLADGGSVSETESRFVTTGNVNVRAGAGTSYAKIGKLKKGEGLQVTGILYDAKKKAAWAMVDYQGKSGCVSLRYLNIDPQ